MNTYEKVALDKISDIKIRVENNSIQINKIVDEIIQPYCKDLDKYITFIRTILQDGEQPPTTEELDDFCLNLSTLIYFASCMCEQIGIRDDIGKAIYRETYNSYRDTIDHGTVADKNALAELNSQQEQLVSICYTRAYKIMKNKVDSAQELLGSCKKVLSRRISEMELTHLGGSK